MSTVTAFVMTLNEEEMLPLCLEQLKWADEMLVVDSGSTDRTVELAKAAGARVEHHPFTGFADQCNWAFSQAKSEWILHVDADEMVSSELADSVRKTVNSNPREEIFNVTRDSCAWGRFMRATSWSGESIPRLAKKGALRFEGEVHPAPVTDGRPIGKLNGKLLHYSYRSVDQYFKKFDLYSTMWAAQAWEKGRRTSIPNALVSASWRTFHNYFLRGEILDGRVGFVMSVLAGMHTFIRHIKLWGIQNADTFRRITPYRGEDFTHVRKQPADERGGRGSGEGGSTGA